MAFNTTGFWLFFAVFYLVYLPLPRRWANLWLLAGGYVFYALWNWRYLPLLIAVTVINGVCAAHLTPTAEPRRRRRLLWAVLVADVFILMIFKSSGLLGELGAALKASLSPGGPGLSGAVVPLGLSFYLLQAITYPVDVYRGRLAPARWSDWAVCVNFFPCLIAGPIQKVRDLLPQVNDRPRAGAEVFRQGAALIALGLVKKLLFADNFGRLASAVYQQPASFGAAEHWLALYCFTLFLYADFSGYSDAARGLAKLLGFEVGRNFRNPFFSRSPMELWQRWHVSLLEWAREYVFYPLGLVRIGSVHPPAWAVVCVTWLVVGVWHGPTPVFAAWALYHAGLLILWRRYEKSLSRLPGPLVAGIVFHLFMFGLLAFAADTPARLDALAACLIGAGRTQLELNPQVIGIVMGLMAGLFALERAQYRSDDELVFLKWGLPSRVAFYVGVFYLTVMLGHFGAQPYFYFQF
ncbi:MAG: hypothetical protein MOGMAGMI_01777 [Candidatus Omnitrophica bacterium]|nr:hypothetical protein [Candidatus Omnitrophota bacterium]